MSSRRIILAAWLPVLLWMLVIFAGSTDVLSSQRTSRVIGPLLRWLVPGISPATIRSVQFGIRKCGHLAEYAVLAVLLRRALHRSSSFLPPWRPRREVAVLAMAILYAVTDELHQGFVATRYGSAVDVLIDAFGALLGLAVVKLLLKRKQRRLQAADGPRQLGAPSGIRSPGQPPNLF